MFFQEKKSKSAWLLQLVENHRNTEGKVCQRIVVSLGGCPVPDEYRKRVAAEITHRASEHELPNWLGTTALGDLLGFHAEGVIIRHKVFAGKPATAKRS